MFSTVGMTRTGWVGGWLHPDPAEFVSPVDLVGPYLIDAWGGVHVMIDLQSPASDVFSIDRLATVQQQLVSLLLRLPENIGEVEFVFTAAGNYLPLLDQYRLLPHSRPVLAGIRDIRAREVEGEIKNGSLVPSSTHMTLGSVALARNKLRYLRQPISELDFKRILPSLKNAVETSLDWARRVDAKATVMEPVQIADYFYQTMNPRSAVELGVPVSFKPGETQFLDAWLIGEVDTAPWKLDSSIPSHSGLMRWDDTFHTIISLFGKPQETWPRISDAVSSNIPFRQFKVCLRIRKLDQAVERERLRKRRVDAEAAKDMTDNWINMVINPMSKTGKTQGGDSTNVEANDAVSEANELLSDLRSNRETLMAADMTWHLWHRDPHELMRRRDILLTRLGDMGAARGYVERHGVLPIILQSMPGAGGPLLEPKRYRSRMIADMCPMNRGFETRDKPVGLFRNGANGLLPIDLFDLSAASAPMNFISGATGAGKSVLAQCLLASHALDKVRVIILDVGGSYNEIAGILGIKVFTFNPKNPVCFNIFQVLADPAITSREGGLHEPTDVELSRYGRAVESFLIEDDTQLSTEERNLVSVAIVHAFTHALAKRQKLVTISDVSEALQNQGARTLVERLKPYVRGGAWGNWFDGPTEWRHTGDALVLDLQGFNDYPDLARPLIPICVDMIGELVLNSHDVQKIFICDEILAYAKNPLIMETILGAFKRYRKENTAVIGVSQTIADLNLSADVGKLLRQSVQTWFLLNQGGETNIRLMEELLALTSGQTEILRDLRSSRKINDQGRADIFEECLMVRGEGPKRESGRLRVRLSPEEYWLYSTHPPERVQRKRAIEAANGDVWLALQALAREYPIGLRK